MCKLVNPEKMYEHIKGQPWKAKVSKKVNVVSTKCDQNIITTFVEFSIIHCDIKHFIKIVQRCTTCAVLGVFKNNCLHYNVQINSNRQ